MKPSERALWARYVQGNLALVADADEVAPLLLELPYPPTINTYWQFLPTVGAVISAEGKRYRRDVGALVMAARCAHYFGKRRLAVEILAFPPDRMARDLDNLNKALLDALEAAAVFDNDAQVDDLRIRRAAPTRGGLVQVRIAEHRETPPCR